MHQMMNVRGHYTGYMLHAISAVDIALWDIRGKKLGEPVAKLLGGLFRTHLPAYVSGIRGTTLVEKAATLRRFMDAGFTAVKTFLGFGVESDLEHVSAFSDVMKGRGQLMVDAL
jgi:L-alanine-DL-glutamate epimerase-like enolase superfamily enzyme